MNKCFYFSSHKLGYFIFALVFTFSIKLNAQYVGIGTSNPHAKLTIYDDVISGTLYQNPSSDTTASDGFYSGFVPFSNNAAIMNFENANLSLGTNNVQLLHLNPNGGIGIGTSNPASTSVLDITSTDKGLLIPRMSTSQRTAIISPAEGLMVYDLTEDKFFYYKSGFGWTDMSKLQLPYSVGDASPTSFYITNSASGGVAIAGNVNSGNTTGAGIRGSGNGGVSVGVRAYNTDGNALLAETTPTSTAVAAVKGVSLSSTTGTGVLGVSDGVGGYGVYGTTLNGYGVVGYGNNASSTAVYGSSLSGIGVKASSLSGNALEVNGKVKISGGNTNPSNGAVLTSDASGNAVWKKTKVGFVSWSYSNSNINEATWTYITGLSEYYDGGNNFNPTGSPVDAETFIAPVSGLYEMNGQYNMTYSDATDNIAYCQLRFVINGVGSTVHSSHGVYVGVLSSESSINVCELMHLNAGDKIRVQALHYNDEDNPAILQQKGFSGKLIFED